MKFKFNPSLPHHVEAIDAVVDLFEGQSVDDNTDYSTAFQVFDTELFAAASAGPVAALKSKENPLDLTMMGNCLRKVQERNDLEPSKKLLSTNYGDHNGPVCPHFSIEMETGTGKTYVYLRTVFELHKKYGLSKFIVVVPSVAIREGTLKTIEMTRDHLRGLYDNVAFDSFVYDSKKLGRVRQFATSNQLQIMVINIDAFRGAKDTRIFNQERDQLSGNKPVDFISAVRPIVIIDEPQSVDNTLPAQRAIQTLSPLCTLRYSATHANLHNLIYKLDPVRAYDLRLVKRIEVSSVVEDENFNEEFLKVEKIDLKNGGSTIRAKLKIHVDGPGGPKVKSVTVKRGDDLAMKSDRAGYQEGWIVSTINAEPGFEYVEFANGRILQQGEELGGMSDEIQKRQVYETVERHLMKEKRLQAQKIKVLSLFFIDRVANYRDYDAAGNPVKGKFGRWFEEAFRELTAKPIYAGLIPFNAEDIHNGYFSQDKKRFTDTSGSTKADEDTYALIMRDKERLLDRNVPLRFIFSHSALREGWDNPNVFQICNLREMGTDTERRQTLGRGLRLSRNDDGEVVHDEHVNRLTVIANETFESYARGLQEDIERDTGIEFGKVKPDAFAKILKPAEPGQPDEERQSIGRESSQQIWKEVRENGYLTEKGEITSKFSPDEDHFVLDISDGFKPLRPAIVDVMRSFLFKDRIVNVRERRTLKYNKRVELTPGFKELWTRINKRTTYRVEFDTESLIEACAKAISEMPKIRPVQLSLQRTETNITEAGVVGKTLHDSAQEVNGPSRLPDILAQLQRDTELTRSTLVEVLVKSDRLADFLVNPQAFITETSKQISRCLHNVVIDGIKYEKVVGLEYDVRLFEEPEIEEYLSRLYEVQNQEKTLYDHVVYDSEVEKKFAEELDGREDVKLFVKLPGWFRVPTPVGSYNPDWAIVAEKDERVYLVRETKSTTDTGKRRNSENQKIKCGRRHFEAIEVDFDDCTSVSEALAEAK
jgi:type III restriction enzyme